MKLFLKKLLIFSLLFLTIGIAGFFAPPTPYALRSFLFAQIDKDSLLVNTPAPRLVLIGGSTLSMGINSQLFKDSLKLNPVNTAILSGVGLEYMLNHSRQFIKAGDIVIVVPDYDQFYGNKMYGQDGLLRTVLDVSRKDYSVLSFNQWLNIMPYLPEYVYSKFNVLEYKSTKKNDMPAVYERRSFNKFGDHTANWGQEPKTIDALSEIISDFNYQAINELRNFKDEMQQKGATVYVGFQAMQIRSFKKNIDKINHVHQELHRYGFKLLGTPEKYELADSFLYDSPDHLTKKGADFRTKLLINDINGYKH
jgi:hypothetical protein